MANIERKKMDSDIPAPDINPDKVCFVIAKSRELEAEDEGLEADASNPTDDEFASILTGEGYETIKQELAAFIAGLDDDEKCEVVALVWTGRGDYTAKEWRVAVSQARSRQEMDTAAYLLGIPLLSVYLEAGMAEFDMSCQDFDSRNYG
ncbi:DUF3775 domain-containing protein [Methylovirgula sp. HY1]|uniref:DUF3775 domain-containing protein n=1 Tax=Methylovirgula sp. HY1 TaxID=2822761 RepID=UPI001C78469D|nr:DUF3775 domain-containing protein [Methylovirgula sp. HY1]QXX73334.1 hypothetical protein MHY1_00129 [Methylovirgula sp. HY1]